MEDPGGSDPEGPPTAELAPSSHERRDLPALRGELRDHLPGLEPERRLSDWGRSERVEGLLDRTVYHFLYHYWFRVEAQGVENVPEMGGALLVANHAGPLPPDGAMIAKAIREEHPGPRPVHFATTRGLHALPGLGMLAMKLGGVANHPANLHRLLFDEQQLVLVFPEGRAGAEKPLKERYRLRRFDPSFVEAALRAGVPIVPIAVLGTEEALPVAGRVRPLARLQPVVQLTRLARLPGIAPPRLPVSPTIPLPAKFRLRFLEPVDTESLGRAPWRQRALVQALARDIRALIQENLLELVAQRRSVWLG